MTLYRLDASIRVPRVPTAVPWPTLSSRNGPRDTPMTL